jgi:hypothetical protein
MFKPGTLLIVGAGASEEAGFPLGTDLVEQIASSLRLFERDTLTAMRSLTFANRRLMASVLASVEPGGI